MILGISASGRKNMITDLAVKEILDSTELDYNFISLSDKKIGGCIGCLRCIKDNRCHVGDDWPWIAEEMIKAKVIVFGAPNYYGNINAWDMPVWKEPSVSGTRVLSPLQVSLES